MPEAPKISADYNLYEKNKKALEFVEQVTSNPDEVQQKVLEQILTHNARVEYLQKYGLNSHKDRESFKNTIPVISYEDIQPSITRIANGDTSPILCSNPISEFLTRLVFFQFHPFNF